MNVFLKIVASCILLVCAVPSFAQYRCGNSFQDTPCASGNTASIAAQNRLAANAPSAEVATSQNGSPFAVACARWGKSALEVAWKREAGALREAQLAKPSDDISRKEYASVVDSVYAKRGAAFLIRTQMEAECIVQKQQEADEAAALAVMARKLGTSETTQALGGANNDASSKSASRDGRVKVFNQADRQDTCAVLQDKLLAVRNSAKRGGSAAVMEKLNDDRRELEQRISISKC